MLDTRVIYADMPTKIRAYTMADADMYYTIVINARLSYDGRMQAYAHEMHHLMRGDYEKGDADRIELFAHR